MRVYIVGAGPGDPSLITVRAQQCLARADVVVYDHRVDARVLDLAPEEAERIDVGAAAPRPLEKDAISYLVAEKAREGKVVVRLKWGDPFVFDSGGKEAIFLHEQQIPFDVVPGIPVAVAGTAYAGVPLTYPLAGDTVVLLRGHEAETDVSIEVDWTALARLGGTIVCYAGARQVGEIVHGLLAHGKPPEETAALVYGATTVSQDTITGTLEGIAQQALPDRPALLIVGRVAGLREHLRWFDRRPLFGRRIVVTRAREQAGDLIRSLEDLGAETVAMPMIRIAPAEDLAPVDAAIDAVETFDWIVFTSANGVEHFMDRFLERRDVRDLKGIRLCAIGSETAGRLERIGLRVDLMPSEYRAEGLLSAFGDGEVSGRRFLLPRAQIARELLADELRKAGGVAVELTAYRTLPVADGGGEDVYRLLLDRRIDAVTFTSASTVRHFVDLLGSDQAVDLLRTTAVAAIGPVTAEAAQQLGITATIVPERYTVPALVGALVEHFRHHPPTAPEVR
jgi:uroporphyrinogen III methyltransferase/synthase